jgi:hypothetical protein
VCVQGFLYRPIPTLEGIVCCHVISPTWGSQLAEGQMKLLGRTRKILGQYRHNEGAFASSNYFITGPQSLSENF